MLLTSPRYVLLDTATIGHLAKGSGDATIKEIVSILSSGDWIPVLAFHILEELCSHDNDDVVKSRLEFLQQLPYLTYIRTEEEKANVGSHLDLREREIRHAIQHPESSLEEVVEAVRPTLLNGFVSGRQFHDENHEWWNIYRHLFADRFKKRNAEIVNLTHFNSDDPDERIPAKGTKVIARSAPAASSRFAKLARVLEDNIVASGDVRGRFNPKALATDFMQDCFTSPPFVLGPDEQEHDYDAFLAAFEVLRERLPPRATSADVGYEAVFVAQMKVFAERMLLRHQDLLAAIRKEMLPSWVVTHAVDRGMKTLPRAEIGNLNDKHSTEFGLYVDLLNVDKRVADIVRRAASKHTLLKLVHERIPEARGISGLLAALKQQKAMP